MVGWGSLGLAEPDDAILDRIGGVADRTAERTRAHLAVLHRVGEEDEERLVVRGRAAQMVGEFDEHSLTSQVEHLTLLLDLRVDQKVGALKYEAEGKDEVGKDSYQKRNLPSLRAIC